MNTLRLRLVLSYALVVVVTVAVIGVALVFFLSTNPVVRQLDTLELATAAREAVAQYPLPVQGVARELDQWVLDLAGASGARVVMFVPAGERLIDSAVLSGERASSDLDPRAVVASDFTTVAGSLRQGLVRDTTGKAWTVVTITLRRNGAVVAFLQPRTTTVQFFRAILLAPLLQAGLVGLLLGGVATLVIARWISRPIRQVAQATEAIGQGDLDVRVPESGPDEVRQLAHTVNQMAAEVKQSQQSQRDFVANVSHELKTPLTSIQGFSQAILDGTASDEASTQQAAQVIHDEAERMRRLVVGLLDLARLESGQTTLNFETTDLSAVLRAVLQRLEKKASDQQVAMTVQVPALPLIRADGDRLVQVFTNLVENAIKHTPAGGQVQVMARDRSSVVEIQVRDTGQGIPPEDLPRVFERFYMVDKSRKASKGYGIGLAITKEIIEAHGGKVSAESVVDLGTKFTVLLPVQGRQRQDKTQPKMGRRSE